MQAGTTKVADIEQLEADYRAGVPTIAAVALSHGISSSHLCKMARDRGWTRDLSSKVKARAKAKLTVKQKGISKTKAFNKALSKKKIAEDGSWPGQTDEEIIEMAAEVQAAAVMRFRGHVDTMIEYTMEAAAEAREASKASDETKIELPAVLAHSVSSLSRLYNTFRSVYGIDESTKPGKNLDELSDDELRDRIRLIAEGI